MKKFKQPSKYYEVDCYLLEKIDHSKDLKDIKEKMIKSSANCFLAPTAFLGMKQPQKLCGYCCFRINQLIDERNRLIRDRVINIDDLEHDHMFFVQFLTSEELKDYARELSTLGVNFNTAVNECSRCKSFGGEALKNDFNKATKMTNVVAYEVSGR